MKSIVVIGAGGHAKAVIDVIENQAKHRIIGVIDDYKPAGTSFYHYHVLGDLSWLQDHGSNVEGGIVAIGDNWTRSRIVTRILDQQPAFSFVHAIHPGAHIARGACIGAGSVVMAGAVVNSDTIIGEHGVLYPQSSIDHDCRTGHYVSFAPSAVTGGNVVIDDYSAIAIGANVIHGIHIGEHSVIGAGSTVLSSIPSYSVAYGSPAKVVRTRKIGDAYL